MARTYHRDSKGRFAKRGGGGGGSRSLPISFIPGSALGSVKATKQSSVSVKKTSPANNAVIQTINGGTITKEQAAAIMFGTARRKPKAKARKRR